MSSPLERYQKLGIKNSLSKTYQYPLACKELSFILRNAYNRFSKNLQSVIFQDILFAFRILPEMRTQDAVSAANLLFQSVEAVLPKQKRGQAVTEFKQAKVAHKRRSKARQEEGSVQLPQDVLVHAFTFLDMQSLVSAALVCWSWNSAASDNHLWQSQYNIFFGGSDNKHTLPENVTNDGNDWREVFKRAFTGNSLKKFTSSRGYCSHCNAIVWLSNTRCTNERCRLTPENQQIKAVTFRQIVDNIMDGSLPTLSSSDSDSDSDSDEETSGLKLWACPRHLGY